MSLFLNNLGDEGTAIRTVGRSACGGTPEKDWGTHVGGLRDLGDDRTSGSGGLTQAAWGADVLEVALPVHLKRNQKARSSAASSSSELLESSASKALALAA